MQLGEPAYGKYPTAMDPVNGKYIPAAQFSHDADAVAPTVAEEVPAGQRTQLGLPATAAYVPTAHAVHFADNAAPTAAKLVPGGHHVQDPELPYLPAVQLSRFVYRVEASATESATFHVRK